MKGVKQTDAKFEQMQLCNTTQIGTKKKGRICRRRQVFFHQHNNIGRARVVSVA